MEETQPRRAPASPQKPEVFTCAHPERVSGRSAPAPPAQQGEGPEPGSGGGGGSPHSRRGGDKRTDAGALQVRERRQVSGCRVTGAGGGQHHGRFLTHLPPAKLIYIHLRVQTAAPPVPRPEGTQDDRIQGAKTPPGRLAEPGQKQRPGRAEKRTGLGPEGEAAARPGAPREERRVAPDTSATTWAARTSALGRWGPACGQRAEPQHKDESLSDSITPAFFPLNRKARLCS